MKERDIFVAALAIEDAREREAYLHQSCGEDAGLRERLETLLRVHASLDDLPSQPTDTFAASGKSSAVAYAAGTIIAGKYKLRQKLGLGGMGEVWMAEQTEPVKRQVAIKLIKDDLVSKSTSARFEQERQALALMDHPNIAKVFDAGISEDQRPYFIMELVKGVSIIKYCDQEHLDPAQRLTLFISVCHAVQHAHQKGIIHRDLKPSNILIGLYDGKPIPKVIDFGVAKAVNQKLSEQSLFTEVGSIIGTLEYMAPEQAELNNLDIDTRADIYSLGVILYELLAGSPPFSSQQLRKVAFTEMMRLIREVEPPRPSTKLSKSQELPSIAANRKLEPKRLQHTILGELDWIVMKALAKERDRRYETANGFAMDIQRYLANEPVLAGPPSITYRFRKFVSRHKQLVWAIAAVAVSLICGIIGTTIAMLRARDAEQQAVFEAGEKRKALEASEQSLQAEMVARSKTLEALRAMTDEVMENQLFRRDQLTKETRDFLSKIIKLYESFASITADTVESKAIRAEGNHRVGLLHYRMGEYQKAETALNAAIGVYSPLVIEFPERAQFRQELARAQSNLGNLFRVVGKMSEAESAYLTSLALRQKLVEELPTQSESRQDLARILNNLGILYRSSRRLAESEKVRSESLRLLRQLTIENPDRTDYSFEYAAVSCNLGILLHDLGRLEDAKEAFLRGIAQHQRLTRDLPNVPEHRLELARHTGNLAILLIDLRQRKEAEEAYSQGIAILQQLSVDFPARPEYRLELARMHHNLGELRLSQGQLNEAHSAYSTAASMRRKMVVDFPQNHDLRFGLANSLINLSNLSILKRDVATSRALLREGEPHVQAALNANPRNTEYQQIHLKYMIPTHASLGDAAKAIEASEKLRDTDTGNSPASDAYQAACAIALCIPILEHQQELNPEDAKRQTAIYGDQAVRLLRQAMAKGFKDLEKLKLDKQLDSLRQREDFKKLFSESK